MDILLKKKIAAVFGTVILASGGFYYYQETKSGQENQMNIFPNQAENAFSADPLAAGEKKAPAEKKPSVIKVDVKGAVKAPGVFNAKEGDRVIDLIAAAGNFSREADKDKVNLAQLVQDQMVIYVPEKGEAPGMEGALAAPAGAVSVPQGKGGGGDGKVNLNTASEADLETLTGIGPSKAQAILEYRDKNGGSFKSAEDLKNVPGIGDKTFEKLKDSIFVQ
ncbi:competence protein ComEA [Bacillus sp. OV322]|uniref:helix-hairpin-helix domain-containing protein n=1 Tax=Bacillus sp. OV322 TaxID=1882764 RepID=UPI0008E5552A|nr:helix-hairpin-helix domain-containing protein [Bacillus sp. OV322]SFC37577.1 competence protein ComEA [Bacillus sp. OV322]